MAYLVKVPEEINFATSLYVVFEDSPDRNVLASTTGADDLAALRELQKQATDWGELRCSPSLADAAAQLGIPVGPPDDPAIATCEDAAILTTVMLFGLEQMEFSLMYDFLDACREFEQGREHWCSFLTRPCEVRITGLDVQRSICALQPASVPPTLPLVVLFRNRGDFDRSERILFGGLGVEGLDRLDLFTALPCSDLAPSRAAALRRFGLEMLYVPLHPGPEGMRPVNADELIAMELLLRAMARLDARGRASTSVELTDGSAQVELRMLPPSEMGSVPPAQGLA